MKLRAVMLMAISMVSQVPSVMRGATPANLWSAPGMRKGFFSKDGSWVVALGTSSSGGGRIEIRDTSSGSLLLALSSPFSFDAIALTQDRLTIAASDTELGSGKHPALIRKIYLYRTSDGA